jgi:hypothetical protein
MGDLSHFASELETDARTMERAAKTAANATVRWAAAQLQRGLAARLGIPPGAIRERLKAMLSKSKGPRAGVWVGLRPLNVVRAGAKPSRVGLKVGRQEFPGAFLAKGTDGKKAGLRRKGKARFPLEAASLDVNGAAVPLIRTTVWPAMQAEFIRRFRAELERREKRKT